MTKRTGNAPVTQAGNGPSGALAEALTLLIAGMTTTRTHLLEWVHTLGVEALHAVFTAEAEALCSATITSALRRCNCRRAYRFVSGGARQSDG